METMSPGIVGSGAGHITRVRANFGGALAVMLGASLVALISVAVHAEDLAVFKLVARDGAFDPMKIEVTAGKRFKIEISNEGKGPMEFESRDLKQEKVLASGAKSSLVVNALKPGTYVFFDDYHPDAPKGEIVAK